MSSLVLPSGHEISLLVGTYRLARDPHDNNLYLYRFTSSIEKILLPNCNHMLPYVDLYLPSENKFGSLVLEVDGTTEVYLSPLQKFPFVILPMFRQECEGMEEKEIHFLAAKKSRDIYSIRLLPRHDGSLVLPLDILKEIFGHYVLADYITSEQGDEISFFTGEFFERQYLLFSCLERSENNLLHDGDGIAVCGGPLFAFYKNDISYEDVVRACEKKEMVS